MPFKGINWEEQLPVAIEMGRAGKSLQEIGDHFGVTRQRINQMFKRHGIDHDSVGVKVLTRRSREKAAAQYYNKWGDRTQELYEEKRRKFLNKKHNAKHVGTLFTITFGEVEWPTHCPILGLELDFFAEGRKENSVSFDCIDPSKGYIMGNVTVMSWRANRIKNDGTAEEHKLIYEFMQKCLDNT